MLSFVSLFNNIFALLDGWTLLQILNVDALFPLVGIYWPFQGILLQGGIYEGVFLVIPSKPFFFVEPSHFSSDFPWDFLQIFQKIDFL